MCIFRHSPRTFLFWRKIFGDDYFTVLCVLIPTFRLVDGCEISGNLFVTIMKFSHLYFRNTFFHAKCLDVTIVDLLIFEVVESCVDNDNDVSCCLCLVCIKHLNPYAAVAYLTNTKLCKKTRK